VVRRQATLRANRPDLTAKVRYEESRLRASWPCYTRRMKLPRATASLHRQAARALWHNAPNLPAAEERVRALKQAALHAGLARAMERNPNLGLRPPTYFTPAMLWCGPETEVKTAFGPDFLDLSAASHKLLVPVAMIGNRDRPFGGRGPRRSPNHSI
jgi:hypothetical protein